MSGIINLFEELVLTSDNNEKINRITVKESDTFRGDMLAQKIEFIHSYIFAGETNTKDIWSKAFPNSF